MGDKQARIKFAPMPLRRFRALVKKFGCSTEKSTKEWKVLDSNGVIVSTFAVTHGKRGTSNEVKPIYIKQFLDVFKGD